MWMWNKQGAPLEDPTRECCADDCSWHGKFSFASGRSGPGGRLNPVLTCHLSCLRYFSKIIDEFGQISTARVCSESKVPRNPILSRPFHHSDGHFGVSPALYSLVKSLFLMDKSSDIFMAWLGTPHVSVTASWLRGPQIFLMLQESLYDVLLVNQDASLDEIKMAFKRRALLVHPDKGGSKEAFHVVYQALETLADPAARKTYDDSLALKSRGVAQRQGEPKGKKKAAKKSRAATANQGSPRAEKGTSSGNMESEASSNQPRQTQLLRKVRDLLKQLPRDLRNEVLINEFSQNQRLILEKWMVDTSKAPAQLEAKPVAELAKKRRMGPALTDSADLNKSLVPSAGIDGRISASPLEAKNRSRKKTKSERKRKLSSSGSVFKVNGDTHYKACIRFDALDIHTTGQYDLQTALEYLVILTSVKQKMLDCTAKQSIPFHERLQEALIASAAEQGRDYADLDLRFAIHQPAGFLVAQGFQVRSPSVRSLSDLGKLRNCLRPFRKYAWKWGRSSIFWWYSPVQLQDAWECFQQAVTTAWEIGGVDSSDYIGRIRARREANISVRNRHLQTWECRHMALQDKNRHRPKRLRTPLAFRSQTWERQHMGREDRTIHQRSAPRLARRPGEILAAKLSALKRLLGKWGRMLKAEAQFIDKERHKLFRQQKKHREEQGRLEALRRKRIREQERFRRETLRKRMKSDMMDDLHWIWLQSRHGWEFPSYLLMSFLDVAGEGNRTQGPFCLLSLVILKKPAIFNTFQEIHTSTESLPRGAGATASCLFWVLVASQNMGFGDLGDTTSVQLHAVPQCAFFIVFLCLILRSTGCEIVWG